MKILNIFYNNKKDFNILILKKNNYKFDKKKKKEI